MSTFRLEDKLEEIKVEVVKLFSIKAGDKIFYVPATDYGQAVEKYKERVAEPEDGGDPFEAAVARVADPEKVTVVCDGYHLIMPNNYDIDS